MHLLLQKWAEEYGEILRLNLGPVTAYYVSSDVAVKVCIIAYMLRKEDRKRLTCDCRRYLRRVRHILRKDRGGLLVMR